MRIKQYEVHPHILEACEQRMLESPFRAFNVEAIALLLGVPELINRDFVAPRVADRLIQKYRKAGLIRLGRGRVWHPTNPTT